MQRIDINNPSERKKLIWAIGLGLLAIVFLWWAFFGFGSRSKTTRSAAVQVPTASPGRLQTQPQTETPNEIKGDLLNQLRPVKTDTLFVTAAEPRRNIFAYYEPPPPVVKANGSTPVPTPTPPVLLAAVSPADVYARTPDFTLEIRGDKFTPNMLATLDGRELPTRYVGPQQLVSAVSAAMIATPGVRQVVLKTPDGKLYSNIATLNVAPPPVPNFSYVGIIGTQRYVDTAILQDRTNKEIINVQRGDVLGGRFRVISISEKELVLTDTNLKIKHTLPITSEADRGYSPVQRPTPRPESDDDEP
ncbi:MAG TPA: hypothetical protein VJ124_00210 [Pyrinomonadaceae bacterium]|nr:hypothetical protein [Pyrinomonadaceae bacterium]